MRHVMMGATLLMLGGGAQAQGLVGTSMTSAAFVSTPLCRLLSCSLQSQSVARDNGKRQLLYTTDVNFVIGVTLASSSPSSVVEQGMLALGVIGTSPDAMDGYTQLFATFQKTFLGAVAAPFSRRCLDGTVELARPVRRGVTYVLRCATLRQTMFWAVTPASWSSSVPRR